MALFGVVAAVIVLIITSKWWVDGFVNGTDLFILNVIYGGLAFGVFVMQGAAQIFVLILLIGATAWMVTQFIKDGSRRYHRDQIKSYEKVIQSDPRNLAARGGMADAYYALGDLDGAIATLERAVQVSPSAVRENYQLRKWLQERELRDSKTINCPKCYSKNLWGEVGCRTCGQLIIYPDQKKGAGAALAALGAGKIAIVAIWLVTSCLAMVLVKPAMAALFVVVCCTCASGGCLLMSSKQK